MTFSVERVKNGGGMTYWILYAVGKFNEPVAVICDADMYTIAEQVLGKKHEIGKLGATVKDYRKLHHLTQQEFADMAGISRNRISAIERGVADNMTIATVERIERIFGGD